MNHGLSEQWIAGFGLGYGRNGFSSGASHASIDSLWTGLRTIWEPRPVRLQLLAGYGYDSVDSYRRIAVGQIGRTATSDFAYNRLAATLDLGVDMPVGPILIEPFAQMQVTAWWRGAYREGGAGDIGLAVDDNHGSSLLATAGLRGHWTSGIWSAEGVLGWRGLLTGGRRR